jgi:Mg2+/Co2+ transporter CorB
MLKMTIQTTTIQIQTRRRDISRRADNDDTRTMNQVKIHQSHKIPTYHYQKRMKNTHMENVVLSQQVLRKDKFIGAFHGPCEITRPIQEVRRTNYGYK